MKNKLCAILATALFLVGMAGMASATLLLNGSFEDATNFVDNTVGGTSGSDDTMVLILGDTALTNWDVTGEIAWIGPSNPFGLTASDGSYFLDLTSYPAGGSGGVAQTSAATVIGQSYTLMFDLGASTSYGNPTEIIASATAGSTTQTFNATATSVNYWQTFSMSFFADSTTTTISLTGLGTTYNGDYIGLDKVSLTLNPDQIRPIPEPATMLLLGTGLVGVAGAARRRQKKQT